MCTRPVDNTAPSAAWPRPRGRAALTWASYQTPWGEGRLAADEDGLRLVEMPRVGSVGGAEAGAGSVSSVAGGAGPHGKGSAAQQAVLARWTAALEAYFRGERLFFTADEVPWDDLGLRPFERAVYQALLTVPAGGTVSYGELAEMAGHPRAARAVGTAMAMNPIPVVIPCHRVIRADGSLGQYGDDPEWKPRLLEHERKALRGRREAPPQTAAQGRAHH